MSSILAIARHTFREALRAQVLFVLAGSGLVMVLGATLLAPLALGQVRRIVIDLGLTAMSLVGFLVLVLLGTTLLAREIEGRTVDLLLAKPIRRADYVLGKYLGLAFTVALLVASQAVFMSLTLLLATGEADWRPLIGCGTILVELLMLSGLVLLFGSFAGPLVAAFLLFATYVAGHLVGDLHEFAQAAGLPFLSWCYYALPNLASLDLRPEVVHGFALDPGRIALALAHGGSYTALTLILAVLIFERREFR
jgi:ABC-type transport system involved in multi-copper enzyme maturation permease subunit